MGVRSQILLLSELSAVPSSCRSRQLIAAAPAADMRGQVHAPSLHQLLGRLGRHARRHQWPSLLAGHLRQASQRWFLMRNHVPLSLTVPAVGWVSHQRRMDVWPSLLAGRRCQVAFQFDMLAFDDMPPRAVVIMLLRLFTGQGSGDSGAVSSGGCSAGSCAERLAASSNCATAEDAAVSAAARGAFGVAEGSAESSVASSGCRKLLLKARLKAR